MISQMVQVNKKVANEIEARHAEFPYEFPESTEEAKNKYGETLTLKLIHDSMTLMLQGPARKVLETADAGVDYSAHVAKYMSDHKIEIKRTRGSSAPKVSPYESMARDLADPSKRDAIIEKFRSLGINLDVGGNGTSVEENTDPTHEEPLHMAEEEASTSRRRR